MEVYGVSRIHSQEPPKVGDRVRLLDKLVDRDPIPAGTEGVVRRVTDLGFNRDVGCWQAWVDWDNGRRLALLETDTYALIVEEVER